jgi:hypothetical protein
VVILTSYIISNRSRAAAAAAARGPAAEEEAGVSAWMLAAIMLMLLGGVAGLCASAVALGEGGTAILHCYALSFIGTPYRKTAG